MGGAFKKCISKVSVLNNLLKTLKKINSTSDFMQFKVFVRDVLNVKLSIKKQYFMA